VGPSSQGPPVRKCEDMHPRDSAKGWFLIHTDGRTYLQPPPMPKGSCSLRMFEVDTGQFLRKQYGRGDYRSYSERSRRSANRLYPRQQTQSRRTSAQAAGRLLRKLRKPVWALDCASRHRGFLRLVSGDFKIKNLLQAVGRGTHSPPCQVSPLHRFLRSWIRTHFMIEYHARSDRGAAYHLVTSLTACPLILDTALAFPAHRHRP